MCVCVLPDPVCSVWPADSTRHEGPQSHLGNGTEVTSSSDLRCQMWWGRRDPLVPNIHTYDKHKSTVILVNINMLETEGHTMYSSTSLEKHSFSLLFELSTSNFSSPSRTWYRSAGASGKRVWNS